MLPGSDMELSPPQHRIMSHRKSRHRSTFWVILSGEKERFFSTFLDRVVTAFNVMLQNDIHIRSEFKYSEMNTYPCMNT